MGDVFLAIDESLDRDVVIKILTRERVGSLVYDRIRSRFEQEMRLMVEDLVGNQHVVGVIAGEASEDRCYYVMEFIEGETLEDHLLSRELSGARDCCPL